MWHREVPIEAKCIAPVDAVKNVECERGGNVSIAYDNMALKKGWNYHPLMVEISVGSDEKCQRVCPQGVGTEAREIA